ncbi:proline-rich transmembrane protein 1-like isoform X2 [Watersipora subatra]|uniref:proline-rich transmembrane protein 1-like isoform X2 n=1 Tax=Watersipora subatra TaxID=2589382 RepID=UPI00355B6599
MSAVVGSEEIGSRSIHDHHIADEILPPPYRAVDSLSPSALYNETSQPSGQLPPQSPEDACGNFDELSMSSTSKWSSPRSAYTVSASELPATGVVSSVITSQQMRNMSREKPPNSFMALSVLNMLCCCLLLGMVAVHKSTEVKTALLQGNVSKARRESKAAFYINIIGIVCGIAIIASVVIYYTVFVRQLQHPME